MKTLKLVWQLIIYRPGLFAVNCVSWCLFIAVPLLAGWLTREVFNTLSGHAELGYDSRTLIGALAVIAIGRVMIFTGGRWVFISYWYEIMLLLRRNMLEWIVQGPGTRTLPESPGETVNRFRDDVEDVMEYMDNWIDLAGCILYTVVSLWVLYSIDSRITIVVLIPLVGVVLFAHRMGGRIRIYRRARREATGRVTSFIGEIFGAVQAVKIASAEKEVIGYFRQLNKTRHLASLKDALFRDLLESVNANMINIGMGIILLMASSKMRSGSFTVGDFALFALYLQRITFRMLFFGQMLAQHKRAGVSFERMLELLEGTPDSTLVAKKPVYLTGDFPEIPPVIRENADRIERLTVRGLHYIHPSSGRGIEDISFTLERGSFTVITGRIGAGKTTLLKTLLGLLPRDAGEVEWNGSEIDDLSSFMIPPRAAYTAQVPRLFSESLRSNILLGQPERNGDLNDALRLAVMDADVATLDEGLDTPVGPRGVMLSGGQVQRSAAARMFARNAELLVFDDLSSALDVETEQTLWKQLFLEREVTCIVASHRKGALRAADQIILLNNGTVEAIGKLPDLLEQSEEMQLLWKGEVDG